MATKRIMQGEKARDFTLSNTNDETVNLSNYEGKKNIYLVFNRGFA